MGVKDPDAPSSNEKNKENKSAPRRSSFGMLLRRSKSSEFKKAELARQAAAAVPPAKLPSLPRLHKGPQLPNFGGHLPSQPQQPDLLIRDSVAIMSNNFSQPRTSSLYGTRASVDLPRNVSNHSKVPIPPIPTVDPYARTESMTHRGRYSYASSAVSSINSPRRVRRRKDPTPFNVLVIGARSSGKTSFLNFLKTSLALPPKKKGTRAEDAAAPHDIRSGNFTSSYIETEIDNERIGLTLWDSEGLERNVVDLQLREMSSFFESKFEETFTEEMKVVRAPGVQDTHIHAAFLLLDPSRLDANLATTKGGVSNGMFGKPTSNPRVSGALDEDLDLQVLRALRGKTTIFPVISKADTITTAHMKHLKRSVWDAIKKANLDPLEALGLDDGDEESDLDRLDEEDEDEGSNHSTPKKSHEIQITHSSVPSSPASKRLSTGSIRHFKAENGGSLAVGASDEIPPLPMSIISPDIYEPGVVGRKFPWGFADPMNEEHCDFVKLKEAVFSEWRGELREASRDLWYEGWRTSRLKFREGQQQLRGASSTR